MILKFAEEIFSSVSVQYLKDHNYLLEINKAFHKFINEKTFSKGDSKVSYNDLDSKSKKIIWEKFISELENKFSPIELQVKDIIDSIKIEEVEI